MKSISLYRHIECYSQRSLAYEFDAINGILGVMGSCGYENHRASNIWGLPVACDARHLLRSDTPNHVNPRSLTVNFGRFLTWRSILERHEYRTKLPAKIRFPELALDWYYDLELDMSIECVDSTTLSLS